MAAESQRRENNISALNAAIEALNLAKDLLSITPAKAVCGTVSVILVMIRDSMMNQMDYVELGLACADVCTALGRGLSGKRLKDLNESVCEAVMQLTTAVAEIQRKVTNQSKRSMISRYLNAKHDKEKIAAWKLDLNRILHVFNTELAIIGHVAVSEIHATVSETHATASETHAIVSQLENNATNTQIMVSEIHRTVVKDQKVNDSTRTLSTIEGPLIAAQTQTSIPGESAPLRPRTFFGRDELIEKIVDLAEKFIPIALIGAGGIGKTSIALAVLHHDRVKQRFGHDRRFIRCDQFPASCVHLLQRLSDVIGAGVNNPENLTPLRTFLSSKEMLIVLDNAESILDPQRTNAREIYTVVEELSRFNNICICITSRISITPPGYKSFDVPTLPMDAAHETFYRIYDSDADRSDTVNHILEQLDFHPLSITLLATVAHQNKWDTDRLTREWEKRRTGMLQTYHNESLAATIELSLASPLFQELGPDARALLGIVAFFPQGVDENNLEWLFPTILNRTGIFDRFCTLSLAHRSNGFITMLAPLRDYLSPNDPKTSPLLLATRKQYFTRMSVQIDPDKPELRETQWITSEDVNVEHLLDVFTTIDADSDGIWHACINFMAHLCWHKKRLTTLKPKIEGLPDDNRSKPECLLQLSQLFVSVGNYMECKRLLIRALNLPRPEGSDYLVAITLVELSNVNQAIGFHKEGIQQATEALEIFERLGNTAGQARCLVQLALSLCLDGQLDAAEGAAFRAIDLLPGKGQEFRVCESHRVLGIIYRSKGDAEKAIHHFELAIGIASPFIWHGSLFWLHYGLAHLLRNESRFDDAHTHLERAKSHTADNAYCLGLAVERQAVVWYDQHRLEQARSEVLRAADIYEKLGAAERVERCGRHLRVIEEGLSTLAAFNSQGTKRS